MTEAVQMSVKDVLQMCEHDLAPEVLEALGQVNAQQFADAAGVARQHMLRTANVPVDQSQLTNLAKKIDQLLADAGYQVEAPQGGQTIEVSMSGTAGASAGATAAAVPSPSPFGPNPYLQYVQRDPSAALGGLGAVNPRINKQAVQAGAMSVATFVFLATGADKKLFSTEFWRGLDLEDFEVRRKIFDLTQKVERGQYITPSALKEMFDGVDDLLDARFEDIIKISAKLAGYQELLVMAAQGGEVNLNDIADPLRSLGTVVPVVAQHFSQRMINSPMPEQAAAASEMIKGIMDIIRDPAFLAAVGMPSNLTPDEAAVRFMQKRLGEDLLYKVWLAQDYERLLNLFAECPPTLTGVDKIQYLSAVGLVANELEGHYSFVKPVMDKEVKAPADAGSFRDPGRVAPSQAAANSNARATFSISLRISWGRG